MWSLIDLLVRQLCWQASGARVGDDDAFTATGLNLSDTLNDVLDKLHTHTEYERLQKQCTQFEQELDEQKRRVGELEEQLRLQAAIASDTSVAFICIFQDIH